jgi:hypothetical protein
MIVFQLTCSDAHEFEAWFRSSDSFEQQRAAGDVECPYCGDVHVMKAPMAPNVVTSRQKSAVREQAETQINDEPGNEPRSQPVNQSKTQPSDQAAEVRAREVAEQILRAVGKLRDQVEESTDDVGDKFVDEARRIHYGEAEERGIRGVATDQEASELDEEGIDVFRLPTGPRKNS